MHVPHPPGKMAVRFQRLGVRLGCTRSLASAIMAPSLNTASSTTSSVGKYLRDDVAPGCHKPAGDTDSSSWELTCTRQGLPLRQPTFQQAKNVCARRFMDMEASRRGG